MTMMEMLTIPGMNNSKKILAMYRQSEEQMKKDLEVQRLAAAIMSKKTTKRKRLVLGKLERTPTSYTPSDLVFPNFCKS